MTDFVSLATFYCYMIPIDCKIPKFSLNLFVYFFVTIIIFGELTSATSDEGMTPSDSDHEYFRACCQKVRNYLADFLVGFLGKKPYTLLIPIAI